MLYEPPAAAAGEGGAAPWELGPVVLRPFAPAPLPPPPQQRASSPGGRPASAQALSFQALSFGGSARRSAHCLALHSLS